ncbi:MAG: exonuclease SbcCD subunit D [Nanoarchaeota archaeon]
MKFAHISDCHLGGWRQLELQRLNMESFIIAIDSSIKEKVEFILFTGDLFDTAFPSIEILKETFTEFRKLKDAGIKCYLIAGSHDYSVSGKTFLDVLEKAGLCEICKYDEKEQEVILNPLIYKTFYIYGYPGKKSALEIPSLKKIKIKESYENNFRILMLHTAITEAINLPEEIIDSISLSELPKADYYALGHIHTDFEHQINNKPVIYGGPTFPNNFKELEELKFGRFYIIEVNGYTKTTKKEIKIKDVVLFEIELDNALTGTNKIISELEKGLLKDKIVLLKIYGNLKKGKPSDINYQEIQDYLIKKQAYSFLKNTSKLEQEITELEIDFQSKEVGKVEEFIIDKYKKENPSEFNDLLFQLIDALNIEKQEDETNLAFEKRLLGEMNKVLGVEV